MSAMMTHAYTSHTQIVSYRNHSSFNNHLLVQDFALCPESSQHLQYSYEYQYYLSCLQDLQASHLYRIFQVRTISKMTLLISYLKMLV